MAKTGENPSLLAGEKVVMSSDSGMLTLTNRRVRLDAPGSDTSRYLSMTLDAVASCGVVTRTRPIILALAAIAAVGGVAQNDSQLRFGLLILAGILVLAYLMTRSAMLTISSAGGESIAVPAKGIGRTALIEFIDAVDSAKIEFIGVLRTGSHQDTAQRSA